MAAEIDTYEKGPKQQDKAWIDSAVHETSDATSRTYLGAMIAAIRFWSNRHVVKS